MGGVYVAFDADGRDYAYALHPACCAQDGFEDEQIREIVKMRRQAKRRGGVLRLLSAAEFDLLLKRAEREG